MSPRGESIPLVSFPHLFWFSLFFSTDDEDLHSLPRSRLDSPTPSIRAEQKSSSSLYWRGCRGGIAQGRMYKQKLNELCQQRQWAVPLYTTEKDGPNHNPRFRASVTVGGATFDGPKDIISRSSKQAQNEAAQVALQHFTAEAAALASQPPPIQASCPFEREDNLKKNELKVCGFDANALDMDMRELRYLYKNQLQIYAQKRNLNMPIYDHVCAGSLHAPRFKASVTVDGQTFESPQYVGTLRDAEYAAAEVALMSLSAVGNQEEEQGFYKNLLQEMAQKKGFTMPTYKTTKDGPSHMPTFVSTVKIGGEEFHGNVAKTKKQAEINAAKVAWMGLRKCTSRSLPSGFSSEFQMLHISGASSSLVSTDTLLPIASKPSVLCTKHDAEYNIQADQLRAKDESIDAHVNSSLPHDDGTCVIEEVGGYGNENSTSCLQKPTSMKKRGQAPTQPSFDAIYERLRDPLLEDCVSFDDETPPVSPPSHDPSQLSAVTASMCPAENGESSSLCSRILIYPRKPDFLIPPGTKLLPFSDEMWIAVSVEPSGSVAGSTGA